MHAFSKFKFAKRVFLLLSEKIGISYKVRKDAHKRAPPAGYYDEVPPALSRTDLSLTARNQVAPSACR